MDGHWKLKAAMTTGTEQHLSLSFQTFLERTREAITFSFPHGGLDLMTRSNISLAYDGFWMTVAGSLTSSLHGFSKTLDISVWVKTSRLSHCSTVSNLLRNNNITTILSRNNITKLKIQCFAYCSLHSDVWASLCSSRRAHVCRILQHHNQFGTELKFETSNTYTENGLWLWKHSIFAYSLICGFSSEQEEDVLLNIWK